MAVLPPIAPLTSPAIQQTVYKHVLERRSVDFDFTKELAKHADTILAGGLGVGFDAEHDVGVNQVSVVQVGDTIIRVFYDGGDGGHSYVIAADIATTGGRAWRIEKRLFITGADLTVPIPIGGGDASSDYLGDDVIGGYGAEG